jgi:hypothetical protein
MPRSRKDALPFMLSDKICVYRNKLPMCAICKTVHLNLLNLIKQTYYLNSKIYAAHHFPTLLLPQKLTMSLIWSNQKNNQLSYLNFSGYYMYHTLQPFKDEAQAALFKAPVRTAL